MLVAMKLSGSAIETPSLDHTTGNLYVLEPTVTVSLDSDNQNNAVEGASRGEIDEGTTHTGSDKDLEGLYSKVVKVHGPDCDNDLHATGTIEPTVIPSHNSDDAMEGAPVEGIEDKDATISVEDSMVPDLESLCTKVKKGHRPEHDIDAECLHSRDTKVTKETEV